MNLIFQNINGGLQVNLNATAIKRRRQMHFLSACFEDKIKILHHCSPKADHAIAFRPEI